LDENKKIDEALEKIVEEKKDEIEVKALEDAE
jgi:hypothetical protein